MGLTDRLTGNSEAWRPADNPEHPNPLEIEVLEVEMGDGDYGPFPIVIGVDDSGDEWRVFGFGQVLQGRITKLAPEPGDRMGFRYMGEEPAKNFPGKMYKNYRVLIEKADPTKAGSPNWEEMQKAAEAAASEPF